MFLSFLLVFPDVVFFELIGKYYRSSVFLSFLLVSLGKYDWFMFVISIVVRQYFDVEIHGFCAKQMPGD